MNTQIQNKILTIVLATISMTTMVACSSQSSNSPASSSGSSLPTSVINSAGQSITNCSKDVANIADLSMNLEVYSSGGVQDMNHIRVRFNAFPATFSNNASAIAFFAYGTDSVGNYTSMTQMPFSLEKYAGNGSFTSISNQMNILTWQQLASIAAANSASNTSAAAALASITFVIDLTSMPSSTVMSAALYLNGVGTAASPVSPDRYLQALIPSFLATPNDYIATHNNTLLSLHPFNAYRNSGYSESQFASLGSALCF